MQISVAPGTYVVAVSGGVDSAVLLDLLVKQALTHTLKPHDSRLTTHDSKPLKLIVAHFDHGIRADSELDKKLVQAMAKKHELPFVFKNGQLGPKTSEAAARKARYEFLHQVQKATKAQAIITAHHLDDRLETAVMNLLRGSGRRGLTSLKSTNQILRPLLGYTKDQLQDYAVNHSLKWRDDPSNLETRYKRNHIRHHIMPRFSAGQRAQLLILLDDLQKINNELDSHIVNLLHGQPGLSVLDRGWFIALPHDISREVTHAWLDRHKISNLTRGTVERLLVRMKTAPTGQLIDVDGSSWLHIKGNNLALIPRDR